MSTKTVTKKSFKTTAKTNKENKEVWKPLVNTYRVPLVKIVFTKTGILRAISKSTISHGSAFRWNSNKSGKTIPASRCQVSCIGAILRECVLNKGVKGMDGNALVYGIPVLGSIYHSYEDFLENKDYLSSMNTYFHILDKYYNGSKVEIKKKLCEFISKNIPNKFSIKVSSEYSHLLKKFRK